MHKQLRLWLFGLYLNRLIILTYLRGLCQGACLGYQMNLYKYGMLCVTCSYAAQVTPLGTKEEDSYELRLGKGTGAMGRLESKGPSWVW